MPDGSVPIVRPAQPSDVVSIAEIYAHHVAHGMASFDTAARSEADTAAKIAECDAHAWTFLVAEIDGALVGYAYVTRFRDRPAYALTCENSIYISPSHVGQGFGGKLLAALIEAAERAGSGK